MTLKVRDEADIILDNIRFHAALGVERFIVADHGSTDGTRELLAPYVESGLVLVTEVEGDDVIDLALRNMTGLAQLAREDGADWVIHNDADEFWWPVVGDLRDALAMAADDYGLVLAPRAELPPVIGDDPWPRRMRFRDARALHRPKIAHRALEGVRLHGAHPSTVWAEGSGTGMLGTMKMRSPGDDEGDDAPDDLGGLILAPVFPIRVLHAPIRYLEQYRRRMEIALDSNAWGGRGEELRARRDRGELADVYADLALNPEQVSGQLAAGSLVDDPEPGAFLESCPDPLSGDVIAAPASAWPAERRERELAELQRDAMYSISRRFQVTARQTQARKRKAVRKRRREARQSRPGEDIG